MKDWHMRIIILKYYFLEYNFLQKNQSLTDKYLSVPPNNFCHLRVVVSITKKKGT